MTDTIIKAGVRETARNAWDEINVGNDFYEALDKKVLSMIEQSVERARHNGRRTVKGRDV